MGDTIAALETIMERLRATDQDAANTIDDAIGLLDEAETHVEQLVGGAGAHAARRWLEAIHGSEVTPAELPLTADNAAHARISIAFMAAMLGAKSEWGAGEDGQSLAEIACDYADSILRELDRRQGPT